MAAALGAACTTAVRGAQGGGGGRCHVRHRLLGAAAAVEAACGLLGVAAAVEAHTRRRLFMVAAAVRDARAAAARGLLFELLHQRGPIIPAAHPAAGAPSPSRAAPPSTVGPEVRGRYTMVLLHDRDNSRRQGRRGSTVGTASSVWI